MSDVASSQRNAAIDILRGLVMIIMTLDHARDFWGGYTPSPTDLEVTTAPLFFTRWITHLCAPVFVFLAGTSAYLYGSKRGPTKLARFLLTRGLWLVLIELTICKYVWIPEPGYSVVMLQVIWVIGCSMIVLAGLCFLGPTAVTVIGIVIVCGHNLLDPLVPSGFGNGAGLWTILHEGGRLPLSDGLTWLVSYPLLPWIGVIALGYGFGATIGLNIAIRRKLYMRLGLAMIAAFVLLRAANFYGDPVEWSLQANGMLTLLSFLNAEKYPPSLLYLLMTLGPALCLLSIFTGWGPGRLRNALLVFGRVPLFYYVLHLYLLRFTAIPVSFWLYGAEAVKPPPGPAGSAMLGLSATYISWAIAILILYPACVWFARIKERRRDWWLSYL
ncbi:MAG: DUF1624 domain-containing protein [Gammaproteobacteria bacterium]|jgi:uncharacterized membrane protein|nr:DUF1624 domain-containing protein [Gammaproteobacteria bacterium]